MYLIFIKKLDLDDFMNYYDIAILNDGDFLVPIYDLEYIKTQSIEN